MPQTINEELLDRSVRHNVSVQKLAFGATRDWQVMLDDYDREIYNEILSRPATVDGSLDSKRLAYLLAAIYALNHSAHMNLNSVMRQDLRDFVRYESDFQRSMLVDVLPPGTLVHSPATPDLDKAIIRTPILGRYLNDWQKDFEAARYDRVQAEVQAGMVKGDGSSFIVKALQVGAFTIGARQLTNMGRTFFNSAANRSRTAVYGANSKVIGRWQWAAILDEATCKRCMDLDGEIFDSDTGASEPPLHPSCRCQAVPIADGEPPAGTMRYSGWLQKQSHSVQDEALGPTRAKLFRDGKFPVRKFTDNRHQILTLDQLRQRDAAAFRKLNL